MKENLKRLAAYYKPYKKSFWLDMICAIISAGIALVIPFMVRFVVNNLVNLPESEAITKVIIAGVVLAALIIGQFVCNYIIAYIGHVMGAKIETDMRRDIFEHYQKLSFSFYDDQKTGALLSRVTSDLFDITELLHHGPEIIVISIIRIIGALVIMLIMNPWLALASFALVPFMLFYAFSYNSKMKAAYKQNRVKIGDVNAQVEDSLSGVRVVKSFANEDMENHKFQQGNKAFLKSKRQAYKIMGGYNAGLKAFTAMITVVVMVVGGIMIVKGALTVADMLAFLLYISIFTEPVKQLVDFTEMFQNGYSGFERFVEIMDIDPDIKDRKGAKDLVNVKGEVTFDDVSFNYGKGNEAVFNDISFTVPPGGYYAIVGPSGIGKTTLVSLIPRFYEINEGSIKIDGTDIRDVTQKSLRNNIGVVQQDVYLFMGTVYENILYGRPDATREEVIEAAKNANAHDFIMELPDGYDTIAGERGLQMSGGQRQRIAIARALLKDSPILVMDEAVSNLDTKTDRMIQQTIKNIAKDKTVIMVAHRLSTILEADELVVLKDGCVVQRGHHNELIAKEGYYKELMSAQTK